MGHWTFPSQTPLDAVRTTKVSHRLPMNTTDKTNFDKESKDDWIVTATLTSEQIESYTKHILGNPALWVQSRFTDGEDKPMYSQEQMIEMFNEGFRFVTTRSDLCRKIVPAKKRSTKPYMLLRNMDIGMSIVFPYEKWASVRTAASKIKREFGSVFQTRKLSPAKKEGNIKVTRIS